MTKIIVGLGNVGEEYKGTKHNIGFKVVDTMLQISLSNKKEIACLPDRQGKLGNCLSIGQAGEIRKEYKTNNKLRVEIAEMEINGERMILAKPTTFMNESGISVKKLITNYKLRITNDLIIIHDDITIPLGVIKISVGVGAGKHNGVQSVIDHLKTREFIRLRIGIGRGEGVLTDVVLSKFTPDEREIIESVINKACEAVEYIVRHGAEKAMGKYNRDPNNKNVTHPNDPNV